MKANPDRVNPGLVREAIKKAKDRQSVYSQCVVLSFKTTGRLNCGFDNRDLQAWIDQNMPDYFKK